MECVEPVSQTTEEHTYKLFVGNVPFKCSDEEFTNCFNGVEGFKSADIIRHLFSDVTRGFGFVSFDTEEHLQNFITSAPKIEIRNRQLRFTEYKKITEPKEKVTKQNSYELQLNNIPVNININEFNKILSSMGTVKKYKLNKNNMGKLVGSAIIEVNDRGTYESLLDSSELKINDNIINVEVVEQSPPENTYQHPFNRQHMRRPPVPYFYPRFPPQPSYFNRIRRFHQNNPTNSNNQLNAHL